MRIGKNELRQRWRELRDLVNSWDPIGLIAAGAPPDEYECITGPLLRQLEENSTEQAIAAHLETEFDEHFGVPAVDTSSFTRKAIAWYRERWQGTTAG